MNKKDTVFGVGVIIVIAGLVVGYGVYRKIGSQNALASRIAALSPRGGPPEGIDNLREAIALYEAKIEQHVKDAAQTGVYWKILATRLQEAGLYSDAFDAITRAVEYSPQEATLHYMRGLYAGILAKNAYDALTARRGQYLSIAEQEYLKAIELAEDYGRPRYGLGILYVFELDRPMEAIPHLERYLEISRNNVDAMFVLARAYYMTGSTDQAVELYDRIPGLTKDPQKRQDAENNKRTILGR
ncbi:MAG: tetratricopeptide repeat protein [Spirochaetaceae bacterium]|jgi:tetratricopeptide (TPR) repeat protein|nr:tetratricopeptide repeat protein [Spirochaetaceae bacterium]